MLSVFESLLPVFLLIALGTGLKSVRLIEDAHWTGMERISYFVFFPSLIVQTLYTTDFAAIPASGAVISYLIAFAIIFAFALAIRIPFRNAFALDDPSYSSVFQGFTRWNAFVGMAIAEKLGGPGMFAIVALGIAVLAIPVNIGNVSVVAALGTKKGQSGNAFLLVLRNPLVIGTAIGLFLNLTGIALYAPVGQALELTARVSLPIGLILVGAGLRFIMPRRTVAAAAATGLLKLAVVPAIYAGVAYGLGLRGEELIAIAVSGSVPTAMNGYVLARDLGGDAPLYAAIVTLQTIAAFITIPLVVLTATYFAG